jgi:DNA-binding NtrC family response regulator
MLKKETGEEFARKVLLENVRLNRGNVQETAKEMRCSKNTIYLALEKEKENNLNDKPHIPQIPHTQSTP